MLRSIFGQRCPRCRRGAIFSGRGWIAVHARCPECGLKYEREQGYFVGAMYVSYALAIPPYLAIVSALWLWADWSYQWSLLGAVVAYLPAVPLAMRFSRVLWIYIDQAFDPEK
jgi:uncharacterized protein (DUF983 family)